MKFEEIKRKLKEGDIIRCQSKAVMIRRIAYQDCYRDFSYKNYGGEDKSYIDIEFEDSMGCYHHWKSNLDGGTVEYQDIKNDNFSEATENAVAVCLKYIGKVMPNWYSPENDLLIMVSFADYWLVFLNNSYLGYVDGNEVGEDRCFYNLAECCEHEVEGEFFAVIFPNNIQGLGNEKFTIYKKDFGKAFLSCVPREEKEYLVTYDSSEDDFIDSVNRLRNVFKKCYYDLKFLTWAVSRDLDITGLKETKVDVKVGVSDIRVSAWNRWGKARFVIK